MAPVRLATERLNGPAASVPSAALLEADGPNLTTMEVGALGSMTRLAAILFAWALALGCALANAQAGATLRHPSLPRDLNRSSQTHRGLRWRIRPPSTTFAGAGAGGGRERSSSRVFRTGDLAGKSFQCQHSEPKGAEGIAQFMPRTAGWHGLADPFDPIEALRHSAGYLRELRDRFGNLGLAAAAYNAGPGRVSGWLGSHRPLPGETRNYVATVTGWTADEWASGSPPQRAETTIP
jgi:hypothetical protein